MNPRSRWSLPTLATAALVALAVMVLLPATPAAANDKFAGEWKLDRIEGGSGAPPPEIDMSVAVSDDKLEVEQKIRPVGEEEKELSYTLVTNGEPHDVPGLDRVRKGLVAKWKGKKLNVTYKAEESGRDWDVTETWKLRKGELEVRTVIPVPAMGRTIMWKAIYARP